METEMNTDMNIDMKQENLYIILTKIKDELNDLNRCYSNMENNYRDCKKELKELKLLFEKLKGNKIIF